MTDELLFQLLNHLLAQSLIDKLPNLIVVDAAPGIVSSGFIKDPTSLESFLVKSTGRTPEIGGRVIALATVTAVKSEGVRGGFTQTWNDADVPM